MFAQRASALSADFMSAVVHMYYATSTTHMKHIVKLGEGKYIQLDSYGERHAHPLEPFIVGFFVTAIAAITVGAMLGTDVTKFIQMPNHSTQPTQPLKP